MSKFFDGLEKYIYWTSIPKIGLNDIVDILIVSVMIYLIVKWIKTTRAWVLLKGIIILLCIAFAANLLKFPLPFLCPVLYVLVYVLFFLN